MFCRVCGAEIADDAVVCVKCGRATGVALAPVQPPPQAVPAAPTDDATGLTIAGFILALVIPLIGLILGLVLLGKGKGGTGLGVVVLSLVSWVLWCGVAMGG